MAASNMEALKILSMASEGAAEADSGNLKGPSSPSSPLHNFDNQERFVVENDNGMEEDYGVLELTDSDTESIISLTGSGTTPGMDGEVSEVDTVVEVVDMDYGAYCNQPKRMASTGEKLRFLTACDMGDIKTVRRMLSWGGSYLRDCRSYGISNMTGLHRAVVAGHLAVVEYLVNDCNASITTKDSCGYTPLHLARKSLEITQFLIKRGANPDASSRWGSTPLHMGGITKDVASYLVHTCDAQPIKNESGRYPPIINQI